MRLQTGIRARGGKVENQLAAWDASLRGYVLVIGVGRAAGWRGTLARWLRLPGGQHLSPPEGVTREVFKDLASAQQWWACSACPESWRVWAATLTDAQRSALQDALQGWARGA